MTMDHAASIELYQTLHATLIKITSRNANICYFLSAFWFTLKDIHLPQAHELYVNILALTC